MAAPPREKRRCALVCKSDAGEIPEDRGLGLLLLLGGGACLIVLLRGGAALLLLLLELVGWLVCHGLGPFL